MTQIMTPDAGSLANVPLTEWHCSSCERFMPIDQLYKVVGEWHAYTGRPLVFICERCRTWHAEMGIDPLPVAQPGVFDAAEHIRRAQDGGVEYRWDGLWPDGQK